MASVPLAIGQNPATTPQNAEVGNPPSTEINLLNQSDKITFPQLMKKLKSGGDKREDIPAGLMVNPGVHAMDSALPLAGIQLPLSLAQGSLSSQADQTDATISGKPDVESAVDSGSSIMIALKGEGRGDGGKGRQQAVIPMRDKASAVLHTAQQPSGDSAAKTPPTSAVDEQQSQVTTKFDFSALLPPTQSNQLIAQTLAHDLNGVVLDKHAGLIDPSSHMALDAANGVHGLPQGTDRSGQTSALPPAISVPLKNPQWSDELSNRVMWMVQHDVQTANIKINPPHLGPLEVQISMNKDHVDVSFNSHHAAVNEALDASMPKLKEMLGSSGLQLGSANVAHHSFSGQSQSNNQGTNHQYTDDGNQHIDAPITDNSEMTSASIYSWDIGSGAIDFYA
jgi:flagellar hook-length control protein FliK